ncbi:MAG: class I SAM-dependent methyltransferase [Polyangiaceae bacterium]
MKETTKDAARTATRDTARDHSTFDRAYYDKHYESVATRVHGPREIAALASGVVGMMKWYGAPIRNVLDVGAGPGLWRDWFKTELPRTRYRSVEYSTYACERYGHEHGNLVTLSGNEAYDLVVCQGVLPYINDEDLPKAMAKLAKFSGGFLYLECVTERDLRTVCDRDLTDTHIHRRKGSVYRAHLDKHFVPVGAGLYYAKKGPCVFYELETPGRVPLASKKSPTGRKTRASASRPMNKSA